MTDSREARPTTAEGAAPLDAQYEQLPVPSTWEATYGTVSQSIRRFVRTQPLGALSLAFIGFFALVAIFAPFVAPYDPVQQHRGHVFVGPTGQYLLGTDDLGRDVLSRVIHGARTSLLIGIITVGISVVLGTCVGVISGYLGKAVDILIQRVMDAIVSVPPLVLLLLIAVVLGPAIRNVIIALIIVTAPEFNRVARGEALRLREEGYIEAARATGTGALRIMRRHILPNMLASILTLASLIFATVLIVESALSFLGLGTPPPTPSWGRMLSDGLRFVQRAPWLTLAPGVVLSLAVLSFNLLGDALRDFLDPKMGR